MILEHVGLTVNDLDRSIDFYIQVFAFKVLRKTTMNAYLYLDNELLELMQSEASIEPETPKTPEEWMQRMKGPAGLNHLGLRVDDLDAAIEKIIGLGGDLVVPPMEFTPEIEYMAEPAEDKLRRAARPVDKPSWRVAVFSDPDGIMLELVER
jgi:catechol 2,3-dioxygenase-like lactoylglutathione lyase family enzyme